MNKEFFFNNYFNKALFLGKFHRVAYKINKN